MFAVVYQSQRVPPMPPGRLAAPLVSMVFTEPPPPEPSISRIMGRRKSCAISSAISGLAEIEASAEPPRTVKSSPTTTTVRPSILPRPNTQFAGVRFLSSPLSSYSAMPEIAPIARANASRRAGSSSSGFQFIRNLRVDDFIIMGCYRKRLSLQPVVEEFSVAAFKQAADRGAQLQKLWGHLLVQPRLIIHGREKSDRDRDEGLVLRRPHRHREAVDMRAPQTAGDDVAMFAQEAPVVLEARPQQLGVFGKLPFHFCEQGIADFDIERRRIGVARGSACHGDAASDGFRWDEDAS